MDLSLSFVFLVVMCALSLNGFMNLLVRCRLEKTSTLISRSSHIGLVTLCIPVRNEEENLKQLIPLLESLDPRPAEILILDDQSTDQTSQLLRDLSQGCSDVRIISGTPLPSGWRGKVWALFQLAQTAKTPWVLTVDADVRWSTPDVLNQILFHAERSGIWNSKGMLSVFPSPAVSWTVSLVVDQIYLHLLYCLPFFERWIPLKGASAGCGQVMLLPREPLLVCLNSQLRRSTHDGLRLSRLFRSLKKPVHFVLGGSLVKVRSYQTFADAYRALLRNDFEATGNWFVAALLSSVMTIFSVAPWFLLTPTKTLTRFEMAALIFYGVTHLWMTIRLNLNFWISFVLFPVTTLLSVTIHFWSLAKARSGFKMVWRGRELN
jgi:glycosyltransferase involved in cell wall biosynthesis